MIRPNDHGTPFNRTLQLYTHYPQEDLSQTWVRSDCTPRRGHQFKSSFSSITLSEDVNLVPNDLHLLYWNFKIKRIRAVLGTGNLNLFSNRQHIIINERHPLRGAHRRMASWNWQVRSLPAMQRLSPAAEPANRVAALLVNLEELRRITQARTRRFECLESGRAHPIGGRFVEHNSLIFLIHFVCCAEIQMSNLKANFANREDTCAHYTIRFNTLRTARLVLADRPAASALFQAAARRRPLGFGTELFLAFIRKKHIKIKPLEMGLKLLKIIKKKWVRFN